MPQPENGQPAPSQPEAPQDTVGPVLPEFRFEQDAVGMAVLAGIDKLAEAARKGGRSPKRMKEGEEVLDIAQLGQNIRAQAEARVIAFTLDLVAPRTDIHPAYSESGENYSWIDFFEAEAAKRMAQAAEAAGDSQPE
jgi:hypothetical protein